MGRKLRHVLIFLLIILKEHNMPEAGCCCPGKWSDCCHNEGLTRIPQNLQRDISELNVGGNSIKTVTPSELFRYTKLTKLCLENNEIRKIKAGTFANSLGLEDLSMVNNKIAEIQPGSFENLTRLKWLYMWDNRITEIKPGTITNLPQLEEVQLARNQITTIHPGALANLPELQFLWLHRNQITVIPSGIFANLPRLESLTLYENQITTIHSGTFENLPRRVVELWGNPLRCDCRMSPVRLNPAFNKQIMYENMICAHPAKLKGKELLDVLPKEFICKEPTINPLENTSKKRATLTSPYETTSVKPESTSSSHQPTTSTRIADIHLTSLKPRYHWLFKFDVATISDPAGTTRATLTSPFAITSENPEYVPRFPIPVPILVCGSVAGTILIGVIILTVWYKIKSRRPHSGLNTNVVVGNTNTTVSVLASAGDNTYDDTDTPHVKAEQSRANIKSLNVGNLSHNQVLAALKPNPKYAGEGNAAVSVIASGDDHQYEDIDKPRVKTGRGQSPAITASTTNTASGDHQYEDIDCPRVKTGQGLSRAMSASPANITATVTASGDHQYEDIDSNHVKTGKVSSQAIIESSTNTTATVMTSGHGRTGQGQYQPLTKANTNTTSDAMAIVRDQTGKDQSQTNTGSLDARNLSYGPEPTVSQLSYLYKTATVMTSGHDHGRQGQSQTNTESNTNTTATVMTSNDDQTGQGHSLTNTERNTNTAATAMAGGHDKAGQGQSKVNTQSLTIANLSRNEVLAALQPNPMYVDSKTLTKDKASTEKISGHDQTGQDR
ncbi:hypothetical protein Bbelb_065310 [Branchiostoma belcheri]|nr:hypothetical protein Bbelb_065310 [Branchiostoma belcheri]